MTWNLRCAALLLPILMSGCTPLTNRLMDGPELSPVGSGLTVGETSPALADAYPAPGDWVGGPADYFRDSRAKRVGDLISVRIGINDNANLNSTSGRSRKGSTNATANFNIAAFAFAGQGSGSGTASNDSASSGQGTVTRSEKLNLTLTVVVRELYPNGNMRVEGSQEILVNMEKRVVHVSGIVDPRLVTPDNSVDYSKIAEARVFYGGAGKISEAQTPRWGTQLWDKINPF